MLKQRRGNNLKYQNDLRTCFHYIHQNPLNANIVKNCKDWPYGSFQDYYGLRDGTLCNKKLAMELLGFSENDFKYDRIANLDDDIIQRCFKRRLATVVA